MRAFWRVVALGQVACAPASSTADETIVGLDGGGVPAGTVGANGGVGGRGASGRVGGDAAPGAAAGADGGRWPDASAGGTGVGGAGGMGGGRPADASAGDAGVGDTGRSGGVSGRPTDSGASEGTGGGAGNGGLDDRCPGRAPDPGEQAAATRWLADLTGTLTSSGQFGVGGTDLGIPVRQPNGQIAYIFGDTFDQDMAGGPGWRSPVLLRSAPGVDGNGIRQKQTNRNNWGPRFGFAYQIQRAHRDPRRLWTLLPA